MIATSTTSPGVMSARPSPGERDAMTEWAVESPLDADAGRPPGAR
jgi:hypothetical protein